MKIKVKMIFAIKTGQTHAFTFVELLLVIALLAVIAGLSIPNFSRTLDHLALDNSSRALQTVIQYLRYRSISEEKIIYLNINPEKKEYYAQFAGDQARIKTGYIPGGIKIGSDSEQIAFYPDGQIGEITISLSGRDNQRILLTTKGVLGDIKVTYEK